MGMETSSTCGMVGIDCCRALWGHAEKTEYFSGTPWDIPCDCGLSLCHETLAALGGPRANEQCCQEKNLSFLLGEAADDGYAPPSADACAFNATILESYPQEDTLTYSSQAFLEFKLGLCSEREAISAC